MAENHNSNHLDEQSELEHTIHQIYLASFPRKKEGLEKLTALAERGNAEAQFTLSQFYSTSMLWNLVPTVPDDKISEFWLGKSVDSFTRKGEDGDPESLKMLLRIYSNKKSSLYSVEKKMEIERKLFDARLVRAKEGDVRWQFDLVDCYIHGDGVEKNPSEAKNWLQKMENEQTDVDVLNRIGIRYCFLADSESALRVFEKSCSLAENDDCLQLADPLIRDYPDKIADLLQKAADAGNIDAMGRLGKIYLHGWGVIHNNARARHYLNLYESNTHEADSNRFEYTFAADEAELWEMYYRALADGEYDAKAAFRLATSGIMAVSPSSAENINALLREVADCRCIHQAKAECLLGTEAWVERDEKTALNWFERAAEHGNVYSKLVAGSLYLGTDLIESNPEKAAIWLKAAVEEVWTQGHCSSLLRTEESLPHRWSDKLLQTLNALLVKSDLWYLKAADNGDMASQYWIACRYLGENICNLRGDKITLPFGRTEIDSEKGFNYLNRSASQGYAPAEFLLGEKFFSWGLGLTRTPIPRFGEADEEGASALKRGIKLIRKAADNGYLPAKQYIRLNRIDELEEERKFHNLICEE